MKCGREIPEGQVFCSGCLEVMAAHPIPPETHVNIPKRPAKPAEKKSRKITPAEEIRLLKKAIRWLLVTVAILTAAMGMLAILLLQQPQSERRPIGRNYTTAPR